MTAYSYSWTTKDFQQESPDVTANIVSKLLTHFSVTAFSRSDTDTITLPKSKLLPTRHRRHIAKLKEETIDMIEANRAIKKKAEEL